MPRGRPPKNANPVVSGSDAEEDELTIISSVTPRASFVQTGWRAVNDEDDASDDIIVTVEPPYIEDTSEYKEIPGENVVSKVLRKSRRPNGEVVFKTRFEDGHIEKVSSVFSTYAIRRLLYMSLELLSRARSLLPFPYLLFILYPFSVPLYPHHSCINITFLCLHTDSSSSPFALNSHFLQPQRHNPKSAN